MSKHEDEAPVAIPTANEVDDAKEVIEDGEGEHTTHVSAEPTGVNDAPADVVARTADAPAEPAMETTDTDAKPATEMTDALLEPASERTNASAKPAVEATNVSSEPVTETVDALEEPAAVTSDIPVEPTMTADTLADPAVETAHIVEEPAAETADAPAETAKETADTLAEPAAGTADTLAEPAAETAETLPEPAVEAADTLAEPAAEIADRTADLSVATAQPTKKEESSETLEAENKIPDDLYRDLPAPTEDALGVATELVTVTRSFGYDCHRRNNIHNISLSTIVYAAGNILVFHDLETSEQVFLRSTSSGGIGSVAVHPSRRYVAVAEKGEEPPINVYEYPSMRLYRVLKNGARRGYSHVTFNTKGTKLASVAEEPDYTLTVWDWKQEKTIQKSKAFSADVWRVTFAANNDEQLTTAGAGHIRFWRMASTFTGLKLQGDIGKFGRMEISDIGGFVELPDGKVVSGSEWGNMLLWEAGKIKCEIARKGKKPCHAGAIECVFCEDGEIMTAGADGHVRVWDMEIIDLADAPSQEDSTFVMEPMMERKLANDVHIMSMIKSEELGEDESQSVYFIQDKNGTIWKADMAHALTVKAPKNVLSFHAGKILGLDVCPVDNFAATTGSDGSVRVFDYVQNRQVGFYKSENLSAGGSQIVWAPTTVDPDGRTFFAGFADGIVRRYVFALNESSEGNVVLCEIKKPHSDAITLMAVSAQGNSLVTSNGNQLFFFDVDGVNALEPIGFIDMDETIQNFRYDKHGTKLLIALKENAVVEVTIPSLREHNTSKTFKLDNVKMRRFEFKSVMVKIIQMQRAAEEAKNPKKKKKKTEGGEEDDDEEEKEEEEPIIVAPSNLLDAWYTARGTFLLSLDGGDAGYVYECSFDMAEPSMWYPMHNGSTVPIPLVNYNPDSEYTVFGAVDGSIRIHKSSDFTKSMSLPLHYSQAGPISVIKMSFDHKYLMSVGYDGNFFLCNVALDGFKIGNSASDAKPLPSLPDDVTSIKDIVEEGSYSIEEFKQKSEQDKKVMSAEEKKGEVRKEIRLLRRAFEKLLKENAALPETFRIERQDFELDPQFAINAEAATTARMDQLRAEMAWTLEKHTIAHQQLHKRYMCRLKDPRFTVKCIGSHEQVSTYRLIETSDEFKVLSSNIMASIAKMKIWSNRALEKSKQRISKESTQQESTSKNAMEESKNYEEDLVARIKAAKKGLRKDQAERIEAQILRSEEKRKKREARKREAEALEARKPNKDHEDPGDLKEIADATENMGDYKLKTASDFTVRPEERINTTRKRNQIITLRQQIYDAKSLFNSYVKRLRDQKLAAIEQIDSKRARLIEILQELGEPLNMVPPVPITDHDEFPEKKLEYTRETLLEFRDEYAKIQEAERTAAKSKGGGGFGGLGEGGGAAAAENVDDDDEDEEEDEYIEPVDNKAAANVIGDGKMLDTPNVNLCQSVMLRRQTKLHVEKADLLESISKTIKDFDTKVLMLLRAKRDTEVKIKYAEHNHIMYYRELVHLKVFDLREKTIESQRDEKLRELQECVSTATDTEKKHSEKKWLISKLKAEDKEVHREFSAVVEDNKFEKFLTKVFKKKIKKKKVLAEGEEEDSDEDSSSDDDSDYDSDESDDSEIDDSVPQPGCDKELFEKVIALRQRRLQANWALEDETKLCEQLRKDADVLSKKEKTVKAALDIVEQDLADFQREKQAKLNELDTGVPLRLSQIHYCTTKAIPQDLSKALIFDTKNILGLKNRIDQLNREKSLQKEEYKLIKQTQRRLNREKKEKQMTISKLDLKCKELQFLKFGAIIDLETLEKSDMNPQGVELKAQLRDLEHETAMRIREKDEELLALKSMYVDRMRENTDTRLDIVSVSHSKKQYETALRKGQSAIFKDDTARMSKQRKEIQDLQKLSQLQAQEIVRLRNEIEALGKKSGHVVPPSKSPRRPLPSIKT